MKGSRLFRLSFWLGFAVLAALLYGGWVWFVEKVEVPPGKVLVRIHYWGKNLPEGELVAPDESYKGVMLDVWTPGRYFLNPLVWGFELHDLVQVKPGECLVLTRKYGRDIPKERLEAGDFLAGDGEKGIVREVLLPGSHPLNKFAYNWTAVRAVEIKAGEVGVKTLRVGKDPKELKEKIELGKGLYVVDAGYRGVQKETVRDGTYYLNPWVEAITPVEIRSHKVEFSDIVFPSRDGFLLHPHVVVEYAVNSAKAPEVLVRISNEHGELHQQDQSQAEIDKNEILQKVILPHIRGYARLAGSDFDARDFILTDHGVGDKKQLNSRERMQKTIEDKVKPLCAELGINVRAIAMASLEPPKELTELISGRQQARVEQDKLKTQMGQYKSQQKLEAERALTPRAQEETSAKTKLEQEKTLALQRKEVEEQKLKQELENADLRLQAARREAEAMLARGKAEAAVINSQNAADVAGLKKAVQGFNGVQHFAQFHVLSKLGPAVSEIFASDDSELARLLTMYLSPPATISKPPAAASANGAVPSER